MSMLPPVKSLRGVVRVSQAAAAARGSSTPDIPCALWMAQTPVGRQWHLCIKLDSGWKEISVPGGGRPGISDGPTYSYDVKDYYAEEIRTMGVKAWILREVQTWASGVLYGEFSGDVATSPSAITGDNFDQHVNDALASQFVFLDTNNDGIPEFHGK